MKIKKWLAVVGITLLNCGGTALANANVQGLALDSEMKSPLSAKLGVSLRELHKEFIAHTKQGGVTAVRAFTSTDRLPVISEAYVLTKTVASGNTGELLENLSKLGMVGASQYNRIVSGWFPIENLHRLEELNNLRFARPSRAVNRVGLVTSQGDKAQRTERARSKFGVDGSGVRVGVMSDSFDCLGEAVTDIKTDDLPEDITVLEDLGELCDLEGGNDEGRALMQIVHDIAPGASQAFHTASLGPADFANGIIELATEAGAKVIVDDVGYLGEPMFQDGIIAQAVDQVKEMGVAYFSAAGNNARNSYADEFRDSGKLGLNGVRHDFDPGPDVDDLQTITVGSGITSIVFQWDQPFFSVSGPPGSASDVDIILTVNGILVTGGVDSNIGGDPVEIFIVENLGDPTEVEIAIELFEGIPPTRMQYIVFSSSVTIDEFATDSGTVFGQPNADGAQAVGAAFYADTPPFGVRPPKIESFSSAGSVPILFDKQGNRLSTPEERPKPEIVAPDGVNTTFFFPDFDLDDDGFPNFFGTSAAAPHAAGLAALMLQANTLLKPDRLYQIMEKTARDMDDPDTDGFDEGFDFATGYGLLDGKRAVGHVTR